MFMQTDLSKSEIYAILTGVFTASIIISNITAGKTLNLYYITLPCSIILFPIIYVINDILTESYGYQKAKRVIILGFIMNVVALIAYTITIMLPAPSFFVNSEAYSIVLGSTFRLVIAGFAAYLIGSIVNARLMVVLKQKAEEKLFLRCLVSTFTGESLDSFIFLTIGFLGTMPLISLFLMIVTQVFFKTAYEIVIYPVTKHIIMLINQCE